MKRFLLYYLLSFSIINLNGQTWCQKSNYPGNGVIKNFGFTLNQKLYVGCGVTLNSNQSDFWEYNPNSDSWTSVASFPGTPRRSGISVSVNNEGYLGLGWTGSNPLSTFYKYNPSTNSWTQLANYPGLGGRGSFGVSLNGKIYAAAGASSNSAAHSDLWMYDPSGNTWTRITSNWPLSNRTAGISFTDGQFLFFGMGHDFSTDFNDLWRYNPSNNQWSRMASLPSGHRFHPIVFEYQGKFIVGGGRRLGPGGAIYNDYYEYDPTANTWTPIIIHANTARWTALGLSTTDFGYVMSGTLSANSSNSSQYLIDIWEYGIRDLSDTSSVCDTDSSILFPSRKFNNYLWQDGSSDTSFTAKRSGIYWVQSNSNGCVYSDTFKVTIIDSAGFGLGPDTNICSNNSLLLNVGEYGASYLWNDNSTDSTLLINQAGMYHVTVSFGNCVLIDTINITLTPNPQVDLGPDTIICQGNDLRLDVSQSGANYLWQDNSTSSIFTVQQSGLYWVEVDLNGCKARDSIRVYFENYPIVDLGKDTILCEGSTLNFNVNNLGASYLWQDNSISSTYTVQQSGLYWVEVDINGCKERDSIQVIYQLSPNVDLGPDTIICQGNDLRLDVTQSGASYLWQDNSTSSTFTVQQSGLYWVEVDLNGCVKRDSIQVTFQSNPKVDLGLDTTICQGSNLTLDATRVGASYLWQDNSSNSTYTVQQAGLYWVEVDLNGCVDRDSIIISLKTPPKVNLGNDTSVCQADFWLDATTTNGSYLWHDNSVQSTFHVTQTGLYWVEVEVNDCKARDSILVSSSNPPIVNLGDDKSLCIGEAIWLNPVFNSLGTMTWQDSIVADQLAVSDSGNYWVELKNDCGTARDTVSVFTEDCDCRVFMPNVFTPNQDYLNEKFEPVTKCNYLSYRLKIFNRWGTEIYKTDVPNEGWDGTVSGQNAPQGSYVYHLEYSNKVVVGKVLVGTFTLIR